MSEKDEQKTLKKLAKAEAKTAKKVPDGAVQSAPSIQDTDQSTPAERSADAAEKQLAFNRWRLIFAGISAIVALATLAVLLLNS